MKKLKNILFNDVSFDSGFWKERYDLNRDVSLKSVYERFEDSGRFDALRFNYEEGVKPYPHIFYDSDVAKWIEAVGYLITKNGDMPEECKIIDALVDDMAEHQLENGYLNSHYIQIEPENIFTKRGDHELYCAGHLIEAAIAYDAATGKHKFLEVMKKYVDCIEKAFVTEKTAKFSTCGHEEIELALLKLYGYTGEKKYLDLAMFFINERGTVDQPWHDEWNTVYDQSLIPVRQLEMAEGHAVRAVYLYIAMCEAAVLTDDKQLLEACKRLFHSIADKRMYITGGIGSSKLGEAFTVDYDLPNLEAYSESCAAIGLALFALSMQQTELNAEYGDVIERVMYNNMLSSTSLDGKAFFYENPLEYHLADIDKETHVWPKKRTQLPIRHRLEVFGCSCCPPNINRIFARVGDFFFSEYNDALVVNQYAATTLKNDKVELSVKTEYPVNGVVKFELKNCSYAKLLLRIPAWCDDYTVVGAEYTVSGDYIEISSKESEFTVDFNMQPYFVEANPMVRADNGRIALCYGPTVYCLEREDNDYELNALSVSANAPFTKVTGADYLLPDLTTEGTLDVAFTELYRKVKRETAPVQLKFRPYWTFANRAECDMVVWVREKR